MQANATRPLPLSKIVLGRNARTGSIDVADLVESFDRGVPQLQNIVVRVLPGGKYELLAGYRRVQAAREMAWTHVDAKILDVDDVTAECYALEENLRRKSLPNEAAAIARLVELHERHAPSRRGGDRRSIRYTGSNGKVAAPKNAVRLVAELVGQTERNVRRKVAIGRHGTPELQAALIDGKINVLEAERLARLPDTEQRRQLHVPDADVQVKRALSALAFAARTLKAASSIDARLAEDAHEHLRSLKSILAGLKLRRSRAPAGDAADAVDFTPKAANRKLSPVDMRPGRQRPHFTPRRPFVSTTFTSIQATCPDTCAWKGAAGAPGGCYADAGFTAIKGQKLDAAGHGLAADDVIVAEAAAIDAAFRGKQVPQDGARGGRDLRLHVGGDITTSKQAATLGGASSRWRARGGGTVWTFTHSWRRVARSAWGKDVSVLASVEQPHEIEEARRQGYAAALVVSDFPSDKAFSVEGTRTMVIPCPAETTGTTCAECRLCLDHDLLGAQRAIAFKAHGQTASLVRDRLHQLRRRAPSA